MKLPCAQAYIYFVAIFHHNSSSISVPNPLQFSLKNHKNWAQILDSETTINKILKSNMIAGL